jgi:hypothetical protein
MLASIQNPGLDRKVKHLLPHYIRSMSIVQRPIANLPISLMGMHKANQHHITSQVPENYMNLP